jgi:outer membrane protein
MKKIFLILLFAIFSFNSAQAISLSDALLEAYNNNPELNAERENLNVSKEDFNISKSEFLPSLTISGSKSSEDTSKNTDRSGANSAVTDVNSKTQSVLIEQKLFQGFAGIAGYEKNKIGLTLAQAKYLKKEQDVLFKAVEAYTGLAFAKEKLEINLSNVNLSERQVETDQSRLERGEITLADVAQSESSLAESQAKLIESQNEVLTSRLEYEKVIGSLENIDNFNNNYEINFEAPSSLNQAIEISKNNNPDLIISKLEYEQSEKDVTIAKSEFSPSATLSLESSKTDDLSATIDERDKETVKATISWPLFKGGKNFAELNRSKSLKNRKKLLFDYALKSNDADVASAWANLQSTESLLSSVKSQVKAAEIANEGISAEYESGLGRSTLDLIQSNTILLNSKISLANSERNYLLAKFNLLKSIGLLNSDHLKIQ